MKHHSMWNLMLLILILGLTVSCRVTITRNGENDVDAAVQLTLDAIQQTQTAVAVNALDAPQESSPEDDQSAQEPQVEDSEEEEDTCNVSRFVSETIPDGTTFTAGETFTKSWTILNNGTCDWNTGYRMVFEEGDRMNGALTISIDHVIHPGESFTFSTVLTAPASNGDYTGVWRIKSDDDENLGKYWVKISVGVPVTFAVTHVSFYMPHYSIDMGCPGSVTVSAEITTSDGGVVTFIWDDSLGCPGCVTKSISFAGAESKIIQHTMTISSTGDYWAKMYIDAPNHQWFGPVDFHVNCTP